MLQFINILIVDANDTRNTPVLFFNACKKCQTGTVELRQGYDGYEFKCLNCGFAMPYEPAEREHTHPAPVNAA